MKVFIDGSSGTTGLRINERLGGLKGIELIRLPEHLRKDPSARKDALNSADAVFLCLPDAAAIEAVGLIENENVAVFDTSTAHRTSPGWVYGMPELGNGQKEAIAASRRIAVPGCHASGFIVLVAPLIREGFISADALLCCTSLTGYTGGGKSMIADYESSPLPFPLEAPRQYGITQQHKHLKEMVHMTGVKTPPVFCPIVAPFPRGMEVTVPLFARQLKPGVTAENVRTLYKDTYPGPIIRYDESPNCGNFLAANFAAGKDSMHLGVYGNEERILLTAIYDNLGKGASGAAIQCLNIVRHGDMTEGLEL